MARKRMVKPEFFTSLPVSELPLTAALTLVGLYIYCDDYGRGEESTTLIKAAVWPRRKHTEAKIAADLDAIADKKLICRYTVGGCKLLHFPSWFEHQQISHKTDSKLPPCPEHDPALWEIFRNDSGGALERFRRNVVKGSSDQINVVQGDPAPGECRHHVPSADCFVCKQHAAKAAAS
jgi:hypothetical protein